MKIETAKKLLKNSGYRVSFETRKGGILAGDFFPDRDEKPITSLGTAWRLAEQFARVNPRKYVNIYVIHAVDFVPVKNYYIRMLNRYGWDGNKTE